jgi:hypothetical protein
MLNYGGAVGGTRSPWRNRDDQGRADTSDSRYALAEDAFLVFLKDDVKPFVHYLLHTRSFKVRNDRETHHVTSHITVCLFSALFTIFSST